MKTSFFAMLTAIPSCEAGLHANSSKLLIRLVEIIIEYYRITSRGTRVVWDTYERAMGRRSGGSAAVVAVCLSVLISVLILRRYRRTRSRRIRYVCVGEKYYSSSSSSSSSSRFHRELSLKRGSGEPRVIQLPGLSPSSAKPRHTTNPK